MKKIAFLAAFMILLLGLSSAITIEINLFNFGSDEEDNSSQQTPQQQNDSEPENPGRETTVDEQEEIEPDTDVDNDPISEEESQGLGSMIANFVSSFL